MGRPQPFPVVVPGNLVLAIPIMNLPQSVLLMLPFTVSVKTRSVAVSETSMLTMSSVPPPFEMVPSMSPVASM